MTFSVATLQWAGTHWGLIVETILKNGEEELRLGRAFFELGLCLIVIITFLILKSFSDASVMQEGNPKMSEERIPEVGEGDSIIQPNLHRNTLK